MYDDDITRHWLGNKSDLLTALFINSILVFKVSGSCNLGTFLLLWLSPEVRSCTLEISRGGKAPAQRVFCKWDSKHGWWTGQSVFCACHRWKWLFIHPLSCVVLGPKDARVYINSSPASARAGEASHAAKEIYWNDLQSSLVRSSILAVFTQDYSFPVLTGGAEISENGRNALPVSADVLPDTEQQRGPPCQEGFFPIKSGH